MPRDQLAKGIDIHLTFTDRNRFTTQRCNLRAMPDLPRAAKRKRVLPAPEFPFASAAAAGKCCARTGAGQPTRETRKKEPHEAGIWHQCAADAGGRLRSVEARACGLRHAGR